MAHFTRLRIHRNDDGGQSLILNSPEQQRTVQRPFLSLPVRILPDAGLRHKLSKRFLIGRSQSSIGQCRRCYTLHREVDRLLGDLCPASPVTAAAPGRSNRAVAVRRQ
jgi:hypothetical protein